MPAKNERRNLYAPDDVQTCEKLCAIFNMK